ncbi:hypothetical protein P9159_24435 [Bacillus cereus]|nr:hypothetical protein [Bacillus cereus]MEC3249752.1 hypothetical protein [Bacillus cereus]
MRVDDQRTGLEGWASSTPNLLNIAVNRVRKIVLIRNSVSLGKKRYFDTAFKYLSKETVKIE